MLPPVPKVPLAVVVKDGKVKVAVPVGLNGVTAPHRGVQKLMPLTVVLTDAEVGVRLIVPPFRLKSMLSASAAAGSAKANNANKSTRLIFALHCSWSHNCGGCHSLSVGSFCGFCDLASPQRLQRAD